MKPLETAKKSDLIPVLTIVHHMGGEVPKDEVMLDTTGLKDLGLEEFGGVLTEAARLLQVALDSGKWTDAEAYSIFYKTQFLAPMEKIVGVTK